MTDSKKRSAFLGAACAVAVLAGAPAMAVIVDPVSSNVTTRTLSGGDAAFNDICKLGNARGSGNQACEFAIGEMRGGNNALSGDWEVDARNLPGGFAGPDSQQFVWGNGTPTDFVFKYFDGALSLKVGEGTVSTVSGVDLDGMQSMFIRTRAEGGDNPGSVTLSNMTLNGISLPDLTPPGVGSPGAGYLQVAGINWSEDWTLAGSTTFSWSANFPSQSRMNVNFKLTDVPPIPLPAAGWLLLAGLGGLGVIARRKRMSAA